MVRQSRLIWSVFSVRVMKGGPNDGINQFYITRRVQQAEHHISHKGCVSNINALILLTPPLGLKQRPLHSPLECELSAASSMLLVSAVVDAAPYMVSSTLIFILESDLSSLTDSS